MPLFLDRFPLYSWVRGGVRDPLRLWSVSLPAFPTNSAAAPPPSVRPQRWCLDTGFTGEAFAWRPHLEEANLDPRTDLAGGKTVMTASGVRMGLLNRQADLWLFSNIPALRDKPFRLALHQGISFHDAPLSGLPDLHAPLIGVEAFLRAGLRVKVDFRRATVSVWTPGPWYQGIPLLLRRWLPGYSRLPPPW